MGCCAKSCHWRTAVAIPARKPGRRQAGCTRVASSAGGRPPCSRGTSRGSKRACASVLGAPAGQALHATLLPVLQACPGSLLPSMLKIGLRKRGAATPLQRLRFLPLFSSPSYSVARRPSRVLVSCLSLQLPASPFPHHFLSSRVFPLFFLFLFPSSRSQTSPTYRKGRNTGRSPGTGSWHRPRPTLGCPEFETKGPRCSDPANQPSLHQHNLFPRSSSTPGPPASSCLPTRGRTRQDD